MECLKLQYTATLSKLHYFFIKGQLILKCPFGVFKSSKKTTKFFPGFLPQPLKRGQIKKIKAVANHSLYY